MLGRGSIGCMFPFKMSAMRGYVTSFCSFVQSSNMRDYVVLFCLILIFFFENCCRYLIGIARVPFIDYESFAFSTVGGIAFVALYSVFGVFLSLASPKGATSAFQLRCLALTTLLFSIVFYCTAYATNMWHIIVIRLFMGAMQSIVTPFSVDIIGRSFSGEVKGYIMGLFYSATFFAFAFSEGEGTNIYTTHGWKAAYFIFGKLGVAIAVFAWIGSLWFDCDAQAVQASHATSLHGSYGNVSLQSEHGMNSQDEGTRMQPSMCTDAETGTKNPLTAGPTTDYANGTYDDDADGNNEDRDQPTAQSISSPNHTSSTATTNGSCIQRIDAYLSQFSLYQILRHWYAHNCYIYTIILAIGIRLGAGFVASNYWSLFFSPLFHTQGTSVSGVCVYSYNPQIYTDSTEVCTAAFPYCVDKVCSAITATPWHNQGMSADRLISNLSWIPIVGSALGNVVNGWFADWVAQGSRRDTWWLLYCSAAHTYVSTQIYAYYSGITYTNTVLTSSHTHMHTNGSVALHHLVGTEQPVYDDTGIELAVVAMDSSELITEDNHHHNGSINTNTVHTPLPQHDAIASSTAYNSNHNIIAVTDRDIHTSQAASIRMLICAIGNALAIPFVYLALTLGYPHCFWVQICSGWVAESYMSQSLAVVGDYKMLHMQGALTLPAVALFLLLVNNIASGIQFLVPLFESRVGYDGTVEVLFTAASMWPGVNSSSTHTVDTADTLAEFSVAIPDARSLQYGMLAVLTLCYGLSSLLFFCAYFQMRHQHSIA